MPGIESNYAIVQSSVTPQHILLIIRVSTTHAWVVSSMENTFSPVGTELFYGQIIIKVIMLKYPLCEGVCHGFTSLKKNIGFCKVNARKTTSMIVMIPYNY